jgi:type I restriction enzyme S subunit
LRALADGGAQPNLNGIKVKATVIPLPPLEEQRRIVAQVDELMAMCDTLETLLDEQRQVATAFSAVAMQAVTE